MGIDLPLLWAAIIGFGLMMYVVMDGFDLGIGVLYPFVKGHDERDAIVNSVAPVWDGNETWLVLGGAGLLAAFPIVYSFVLSALYIPLAFMLAGLILRGVAFEFRFKADGERREIWGTAFSLGSYVATFFQGASLGALINGFEVKGPAFTGSALDWVTPFSLFCGLGLVVAYALLGATWLVMKTEGDLQRRMIELTAPVAVALLGVIAVVSVWTPLGHPAVAARWFTTPNLFFFLPVPALVLACVLGLLRSLRGEPHAAPFLLALVILFLGYSGLVISLWPHIIPPGLTIHEAAGPPQSLGFTLVGALFITPIILTYTAWSYYVFRGKVEVGVGYH
ncbi:cytochrome d ubiquinol oxidase subunit II [Methylocella sp.]|uniref:cytochrome d ubiquinol oxidase subunit II n=1 Tax=Methylocella sp. TaxID=1978226 RepID=UPI0037852140